MSHIESFPPGQFGSGKPLFRIAIPSWRIGRAEPEAPLPEPRVRPEEFKRLLETEMTRERRLTRAERRQLEIADRVRTALYGPFEDAA